MVKDIVLFAKDFITNFAESDMHHENIKELGLNFSRKTL